MIFQALTNGFECTSYLYHDSLQTKIMQNQVYLTHIPIKTRNEVSYSRVLEAESDSGSMVQAIFLAI